MRRRAPWPLGRLNLDLALFLDAGNVWEDFEAFRKARFAPRFESHYLDVADLRYGYGFGLRYRTPVGPIRADLGFPLKRFGQRTLHLALGHPF
jgi:translocation and assembly module TamA